MRLAIRRSLVATATFAFAAGLGARGVHAAPPGGYWLSAEFDGPEGSQVQAAAEMAGDRERVFTLDEGAAQGAQLPGQAVARSPTVQDAMSWVSRWAFDGALGFPDDVGALRLAPAPEVGGSLLRRFGVRLRSLVVTGATPDDGVRDIHWPVDQRQVLPADSSWRSAALVPSHAAIFAAPSATLPPARERSGEAERAGGLFVLGRVDRCAELPALQPAGAEPAKPVRNCMRWVQVLARSGDRFLPGYLPSFQIAETEAWVRAEGGLPRAQLRAASIEGELARYTLVVRLLDNQLHQTVVERPTVDGGFEDFELSFVAPDERAEDGERATWTLVLQPRQGTTPVHLPLSADIDLRPPPQPKPAPQPKPEPKTVPPSP